jgi:inhibitor of cysteine peptidase
MRIMQWFILILSIFFHSIIFAAKSEPGIYTEDKLNIIVTKDQPQFVIHLKSNPTTGYNWFLREYDAKLITPVKHKYQAPNTKMMGASGYDVWIFSVKPAAFVVPQMTQIRFSYARPWETQGQNKQLAFRVSTSPLQ